MCQTALCTDCLPHVVTLEQVLLHFSPDQDFLRMYQFNLQSGGRSPSCHSTNQKLGPTDVQTFHVYRCYSDHAWACGLATLPSPCHLGARWHLLSGRAQL